MNLYKHVVEQPFVMATGIAALVHSTWSIGTLFSGKQPTAGLSVEFIGWIVPAFLIAFALDVGQIATSAEIRAGNRSWSKYATFGIFAVSTFYLQWLYIAHHMPALDLSLGVRDEWSWIATLLRDASIWIIPAFLPLSTLMYTFSSDHAQHESAPQSNVEPDETPFLPAIVPVQVSRPIPQSLAALVEENEELVTGLPENPVWARCEACGWEKTYKNDDSAKRGLATHLSRHCTAMHPVVSTNGNGAHD